MVNLDAIFETVGATKWKAARPLYVVWRRVRNQSRTSVLAFKWTRDTLSIWDPTSPFWRRSTLGFLWKEWCWSWSSSTLATWCEELTHWKGLWFWEGLGAGGEGDDRGWDGWMASPTRWTQVWMNSGSCWWTGRPGVLRFMGSQRVGHDWATEMNWTELNWTEYVLGPFCYSSWSYLNQCLHDLSWSVVLEHAFGFCTYFSLGFLFYSSKYSHPQNYSRPKPSPLIFKQLSFTPTSHSAFFFA